MNSRGAYNNKGINSQARAALSLFLQFLSQPNFSHIHLEAPRFQDFNLIFDDGKKIICESKDWKEKLNYADLRDIVNNISSAHELNPSDEVLIICTNVNEEMISRVKNTFYWDGENEFFRKKGYTEASIVLLPKVKFWHIKDKFTNQTIYSQFSQLINYWLPQDDIEKIVNKILLEKIYYGSERGDTYFKAEILKEIEKQAEKVKQNSVYYNKKKREEEKAFLELDTALASPTHPTWCVPKELSALSTQWNLLLYAFDRLGKRKDLNLKTWGKVWQLSKTPYLAFRIFDIFKNNLNSESNRKFVISYLKKHITKINTYYYFDNYTYHITQILNFIIDTDDSGQYFEGILLIIESLLTFQEEKLFYVQKDDPNLKRFAHQGLWDLTLKIFTNTTTKDSLKQKIYKLVILNFNLIKDEGKFGNFEAKSPFIIVREWLNEDFTERFFDVVESISNQYDRYYKRIYKDGSFKGWEQSGKTIEVLAGNHHLYDRHFVGFILAPSIIKYYKENETRGWQFVKKHCISNDKQVSKKRPDFLNRSVYGIVLTHYASTNKAISDEAFCILENFIFSKDGIPRKSDLIYQALTDPKLAILQFELANEKKWKLVKLFLDKEGFHINTFIEKIVSNLAQDGHKEAKHQLKIWLNTPNYFKNPFDQNYISNIRQLLTSDFDYAVELFSSLLTSEYICGDYGANFATYKAASLMREILQINYHKGISLLNKLGSQETLSSDQQIVYVASLFNTQGDERAEDFQSLFKVYSDIIIPLLNKYKDSESLRNRFSDARSRELLMQFANRLAINKKISEALQIIKVFIDDPDPSSQFNNIEEGRELSIVTTVRGWCGWALMQCAILEGRNYIQEIIELTEKLIKDNNYYVVHMGCFPLAQLIKNRHSTLPGKPNVLFFNDNPKVALKMAQRLEAMAAELFGRFSSWKPLIQIAMAKTIAKVFNNLKSLSDETAFKLAINISSLPKEAIKEFLPTLFYYAEYRKFAYENWSFKSIGLYEDLSPNQYDDEKFKIILLTILENLQNDNPDNCFQFAVALKNMMENTAAYNKDSSKTIKLGIKYLHILSNKYGRDIYNLIFRAIEEHLETPQNLIDDWYDLLIKCFHTEKAFLESQIRAGNMRVMLLPGLYRADILCLLFDKTGSEKLLEAAEVLFSYPKETSIYEPRELVSKIFELTKSDDLKIKVKAINIIKALAQRDPSKYLDLKRQLGK